MRRDLDAASSVWYRYSMIRDRWSSATAISTGQLRWLWMLWMTCKSASVPADLSASALMLENLYLGKNSMCHVGEFFQPPRVSEKGIKLFLESECIATLKHFLELQTCAPRRSLYSGSVTETWVHVHLVALAVCITVVSALSCIKFSWKNISWPSLRAIARTRLIRGDIFSWFSWTGSPGGAGGPLRSL